MIIAGAKTEVVGVKPIPVPLCPSQIPHGPVWDRMGTVRNIFNVIICFVTFSTMSRFYLKQCKILGGDLFIVR
jgi:hypothetical protein